MQLNERSTVGYKAVLRNEKKSDWKTVEQITYRAFRDAPPTGSGDDGNEALLARKLRSCSSFVPELDYVAEFDGSVIGNIMYARCKVIGDGGEWETLTFGPVSVLPKYQRDGVGSALIRKTLDAARDLGYCAVLIYGHESYYPRFGFMPASEFGITTADGKNFPAFMALPLYDGALHGIRGRFILDDVYTTLDREESDKLNAELAEPMDVDEYIEAQQEMHRDALRTVRQIIRMALPDAMEKIAWQMPTYSAPERLKDFAGKGGASEQSECPPQGERNGAQSATTRNRRNLIHFAAQKYHIGVYPGAEAMEHFKPRLAEYRTSKGAIRFPYKGFGPEQLRLITEIAAWCGKDR